MSYVHKKKDWVPLSMMFLLFFIIAFITNLNVPLGPVIKSQFNLNNFRSGLNLFMFYAAYGIMGIPASYLINNLGFKKSTILSLLILILGCFLFLVASATGNFILFLLSTFINGCSITILQVVVNPFTILLGPKETSTARLNMVGAFNSFGSIIAPFIGGLLLSGNVTIQGASKMYLTLICFILSVLIIIYFVSLPVNETKEEGIRKDNKYHAWSFRHLKLGALAIFSYVGVEVAITYYLYMQLSIPPNQGGYGLDNTTAGAVVSSFFILMLIGRIIGGFLGARISGKSLLLLSSVICSFLSLAPIVNLSGNAKLIALNMDFKPILTNIPLWSLLLLSAGLFHSIMWPSIFTLATKGLGKYTTQGSGFLLVMVTGGAVVPVIQGWISDFAGFRYSYLVCLAGYLYLAYYAIWGSKNVNPYIDV